MNNLTRAQLFVLFNAWSGAIDRCHNPASKSFKDYGARGIAVCERWRGSFDAFVHDMGPRPDGTSLDREEVNGDYEPDNCRWATSDVQARNKRNTKLSAKDSRDIVRLAVEGHSAAAIALVYGVTPAWVRLTVSRAGAAFGADGRGVNGAKLNEGDVRAIRARKAAGETCRAIAESLGVHWRTIHAVVTRQTWAHVT